MLPIELATPVLTDDTNVLKGYADIKPHYPPFVVPYAYIVYLSITHISSVMYMYVWPIGHLFTLVNVY